MIELLTQIRWQFLIFRRNNLITMIAVITAVNVLIIYSLRGLENVEKITTLIIYNDPAVVGFIFTGISIILEKDQEVLAALFVAPLSHHVYLISRIITLSTICTLAAIAMLLTARGTSFNFNAFHFSIGAFATCVFFCLLGIFLVSYTTEILHFLLRSIPLLIFMSLPLLNYFELTDIGLFRFFPVQGGLSLMVNSYSESPDLRELIYGYVSIAAWTLVYWAVYRIFIAKVAKV